MSVMENCSGQFAGLFSCPAYSDMSGVPAVQFATPHLYNMLVQLSEPVMVHDDSAQSRSLDLGAHMWCLGSGFR
jgi:hypothetical protein